MGLSLVRAALKNSALGGILESQTQEQLISAVEQQVQHALAPDGALSTTIRVQMTNVLHQSNKTVREIFVGSDEAGTSAAADDPCVFVLLSPDNTPSILIVYVDDCYVQGERSEDLEYNRRASGVAGMSPGR